MKSRYESTLHLQSVRRYRPLSAGASGLLLALVLTIAGCGLVTTRSGGGDFGGDQAAPTVVLRNPPPGMLDVSMAVTFAQQPGDTQPTVEVGLAFASGGKVVRFAGAERVSCLGADLPTSNRDAVFQVLREPAGQVHDTVIACNYAEGGAVASLMLQIPSPPMIIAPQPGAQVARSPQTLASYRFDPATASILGIVALAPSSPLPKAIARMGTPSSLRATVDTSGFTPGAGSLLLTASLMPHITQSSAPFKSVRAFGTATQSVAVVWL